MKNISKKKKKKKNSNYNCKLKRYLIPTKLHYQATEPSRSTAKLSWSTLPMCDKITGYNQKVLTFSVIFWASGQNAQKYIYLFIYLFFPIVRSDRLEEIKIIIKGGKSLTRLDMNIHFRLICKNQVKIKAEKVSKLVISI